MIQLSIATHFNKAKTFKRNYANIHGYGKGRILVETQLPQNMNGVFSARFSPEGKVIAVACGSGTIQLRDGETGKLQETIRAGYQQAPPALCCQFCPRELHEVQKDKMYSVKKDKDGYKQKSSIDEENTSASESDDEEELQMTESVSASTADRKRTAPIKGSSKEKGYGTFFVGSACGNIFRCVVEEGLCETFNEEKGNEVQSLDIDMTSSMLTSGGKDAVIRIYDIMTAKLFQSYEPSLEGDYKGHNARIFSVRYDPGEKSIFYSGGWDDVVKVWDVRSPGGVVHNLYGPHICGNDGIDVKGEYLLTGSWTVKNALKIWDLRSMKVLEQLKPDNRNYKIDGEFIYSVHFFAGEDSSYDQILVGGSGTGALEIVSRKENKVLGFFPTEKSILTIDSIGPVIIFGGMDNKVKIAEFN